VDQAQVDQPPMAGRPLADMPMTDPSVPLMGNGHLHQHVHTHDQMGVHAHPHEHPHDPVNPRPDDPVEAWGPGGGLGSIRLRHVHFRYPDGFEALRGIDLSVSAGEKVALVGPNGAGKSTLMLLLNGTHRATHGDVRVGGMAIGRDTIRRIRAHVGLVFQDPDDQLFSPTVFDDVAFGPLHMGLPHGEIHARVERALDIVGMRGLEHRVPHRLSLGQRKRVALATVLSMEPSILVFDEPSAGLDPRGRRELIRLLEGLGQTLLVSTHDMRLVAEIFPRTVVVDGGELVADGLTSEILADDALLERHGLERP
jgi:cobalt/nickel transport system ATP-binding protein